MFDRTNEGRWWDFGWQLVEGCTKCSPGCDQCWSLAKEQRFRKETGIVCHPERLERPLKRKKPTSYAIWNDLWHESVPFEFIDKVMAVIALCPQHTFQVLTKRHERMAEYFKSRKKGYVSVKMKRHSRRIGLPSINLWLGTTVCNQPEADKNIPILLQIPAAVRFVSIEPMLEKIVLDNNWLTGYNTEHESKKQRKQGLLGCNSERTENRPAGKNLETQGQTSRQVERGESSDFLQTKTSRTRQRDISPNKNDDRRKKTVCACSSSNMVSSLRENTAGVDNKSQKREKERQSTIESGISDLQRASDTLNKSARPEVSQKRAGTISWIIVGGESGPGARPMHPDWARSIRDQCQAAKVPFFFKQWGEWGIWEPIPADLQKRLRIIGTSEPLSPNTKIKIFSEHKNSTIPLTGWAKVGKKKAGRLLDGAEWSEYPKKRLDR